MSNSQKITQMPSAATPLTGAELVPIVQSGTNKKVPVSQIGAINNLQYQGTWNASTNSPTITSSVGTTGYYYIVSVAGNTTINGNTGWNVGDWIIFSNTGVWQKIGGGTQSAIQIQNDTSSNTNYNVALANATSGFVATEYVDSNDITFNPSTQRLTVTNLTVTTGRGLNLDGATSPIYYQASDNRVTMANYQAGGKLAFEVNGGNYTAYFNADGTYQFGNLYGHSVTSAPLAVYVDSGGTIGYLSSTKESKTNINPMASADWVSKLEPVTFSYRKKAEDGTYTDEAEPHTEYGLIAEDVEKVAPDLCTYHNEKLSGVRYDRLIVPLLKKIQELEARLAAVEAK